MELKEYLKIIKKNLKLFLSIIFVAVLGSLAYFIFRPASYGASLTLNITRSGFQQTDSYRYDDFYRIQADEKFAETVVEWLKSPRMAADILSEAGIPSENLSLRKLGNIITAEKMSSQVVLVSFSSSDQTEAKKISSSVIKNVSANAASLNKDQKEDSWFEIVAQDPLIIKNNFNLIIVFFGSLFAGLFLAFWIVMIKHYLE